MSKNTAMGNTESLLVQTRNLLRSYGIRARKGLGQHFLIDEEVLGIISTAAGIGSGDVVMEVGPGLGVLTRELARQAGRVFAIELDDNLAAILEKTLASLGNVTVINRDVLDILPADLLTEQMTNLPGIITRPFRYKVVANLPYYITAPVLRHFLEAKVKPEVIVVMVQREVAEIIVAKPGRRSLLSISVQLYGEPSIISYVPAHSFYPVPAVESAILRVELFREPAVAAEDAGSFFEVVRVGFSAARKQLGNSLVNGMGLPKAEVLSLLEKVSIDPMRRAETLIVDEWIGLWRAYIAEKGDK